MENKIYTLEEMRSLHICTDEYAFNTTEVGDFDAILDLKAETKKGDVRSFFTLDDGKKFIATSHWFQRYLGIREIPVGTKIRITYSKNNSGNVYLTAVQVLEEIQLQ
ncbi:MAG TPA: hypothetical protein VFD52_06890 [Clostridia bacterium]|nr:hypothetical protein [Clostridia bacterium]